MTLNPFTLLNSFFWKLDKALGHFFFNRVQHLYEAEYGCLRDDEDCWIDPEVIFDIEEEAQARKARCYLYLIMLLSFTCWAMFVFKP